MLSNQKIKLIHSLELKKHRTEAGLFIVEGEKMVDELLNSQFDVDEVFALPSYINQRTKILSPFKVVEISDAQLNRISQLKTPNQVLALVRIPKTELKVDDINDQLVLALDNIQDPGNLGTIIRSASWFGIQHIICSLNTVDVYNPKVVQATMGALFNANIHYCNLSEFLRNTVNHSIPVYATSLQGENVYSMNLSPTGIIVMGNESAGVSSEVMNLASNKLFIPKYAHAPNTESLNVSIATALVCAEFKRRSVLK